MFVQKHGSKVSEKLLSCQFYTFDGLLNRNAMGKGDKKSKRGKINRGSFGVRRPRIKKRPKTEDKINVNKKV